ncbi:MAG: TolC family outer membrane protein [Gammaproteobacteria bacterium]|nr:MAG: TolC family outer membrane protein [Gammaproteobacteria bacterium]
MRRSLKSCVVAGSEVDREPERARFRRFLTSVCILAAVTQISTAFAAGNTQSEPWTLPRLVAYALGNNMGLEAARLFNDVAREDVSVAEGQQLPRLDVVSDLLAFPLNERLLIERHGFRPRSNPFEDVILNYGLRASMPLYTGGRIEKEIALAEAAAAASRARADLTQQGLIFNVTSGYYTYLRLDTVIEAGEGLVRSVKESRRIAQKRLDTGRAAPLDLLRLDTRLSSAESQLRVARNGLERTVATLTALLALPPGTPLTVAGELRAADAPWDAETARQTALSERPDLIALRREVDAQRRRVGIAKSRMLPSIDASAYYGGATGNSGTSTDDAKIFIFFRYPLYSGGELSAAKRREAAKLMQLMARLDAQERDALAEVDQFLVELSSTRARLVAGRRAIIQADEALRVERQKFSGGRGTSNDLLLAEEALLRAKTEVAAIKADSQIAVAALRLATGQLRAPVE